MFTLNPSMMLPYGEGTQFSPNDSGGVANYASGYIEMDASAPVAVPVPVGFKPRRIRVIDVTALEEFEVLDFMQMITPMACLHTTYAAGTGAPTKMIDTTGLITIGNEKAGTAREFIISAAALKMSHNYVFEAFA